MSYNLNNIFYSETTKYELTLFSDDSIKNIENLIYLKNEKPYIKCLVTEKERPARPEEIVRQLWLKKIMEDFHYPKERIGVEVAIWKGSGIHDKAADIIVYRDDRETAYIIFELKKPKRKDGLKQLKVYCNDEGSPIGVWSNGGSKVVLHREDPNIFAEIDLIPSVDETLQDVVENPWTIDKLAEENKLVKEKVSLKRLILDLEDLVLANAKGIDDSFDEVFKLIYAKLYDEWAAVNEPQRNRRIQFRIYGESSEELYDKINGLFHKAINQWRGVFLPTDRIILTPNHLRVCVSFLQGVKLFNANLQVIDDAFEYLSTTVAKKSKGQYFTPRWVIDMCVKMLNPKVNEYLIDPACGSSGFTVHSIFWVAGKKFTAEGLPRYAVEYANSKVFGIDSSPKAVKIAKALNLIAGDGKTNIYELNSLDSKNWEDIGKAAFRPMLTRFDDRNLDQENQKNFKYFDFDILMTNPPFAGPIGERDILKQFVIAEKNGKIMSKVGREILFIEKCLNFLKPGGRCAMILPQGRLNNSSDLRVRNFIFDKARLLAVVGLGVNTFKPHTGTKTSAVFLQKYTETELQNIQKTLSNHESQWEEYLNSIKEISKKSEIKDFDLDNLLISQLNIIFEVDSDDNINECLNEDDDNIEESQVIETEEDIQLSIKEYEE